jgi:hypothetical protein
VPLHIESHLFLFLTLKWVIEKTDMQEKKCNGSYSLPSTKKDIYMLLVSMKILSKIRTRTNVSRANILG